MMKNYKFIISGKVQGVYYRVNIKNNALKHSLKGYVKNLPDGTVEAAVTCNEKDLELFESILHQGSKTSNVLDIKKDEIGEVFTNSFEVR